MNKPEAKRDFSFDVLRFVAISAVIMIHTSSRLFNDFNSADFLVGNIFNAASRFAVPVFMMITGALLLDDKREITYKNIFSKYIGKTVLLFILWSGFYALLFQVIIPLKNGITPLVGEVVSAFFKGHYHMWYLYALMGFYLVLPLLRKLTKTGNEKKVRNIIILLVVIQSVIPLTDLVLKGKTDFSLTEFYADSGIRTLFGFHFYFLLGRYLTTAQAKKSARYALYLCGGISLLATTVFTQIISQQKGCTCTDLYDNLYLNTVIFSVAIFVFFRNICKSKETLSPFVSGVSRLSFGIYIVHPIILEMFCAKSFMPDNPFVYVITLWSITAVLSYLGCLIISKIPIMKKLIRT